jgi:AraC-like DNA-binding protein
MSVFAPIISSLWKQIEDSGLDPEPLFRKHDVSSDTRFDPNARISYTKIDRIRAEAVVLSRDSLFGLKEAKYTSPAQIGPLGFAWLASKNLRAALARLQRYSRVIHDKCQIDLQEENNNIIATIVTTADSENAYHRDGGDLAVLTNMCRFICGKSWSPKKVSISHPEPVDTSYYFAYFRCPIEFGAPLNSLFIDSRQAQEQLTGSNEQLAQLNDHIVVRYLASIDRDDIINQTKTAIMERLGEGGVTETCVADALHVSSRNLHRKLAAENSSFKYLLLEIRTELANQYINDATLTLTEISYMLGFSEVSSFSRAYRRWTGHSPSTARKQHLSILEDQ